MIKVTFLGTGTSQGVPVVACSCSVCLSGNECDKRLRSSLLIEVEGLQIVIDAGPDFRQQMLRANVKKLSAILLTHEHYDHMAGLDEIRAFNWVQKRATDIFAEPRVNRSVRTVFAYVFAIEKYPGIPQMNLHDISDEPFNIKNTTILPLRGYHHKLPVRGYRIDNFAYFTDIKTIEKSEFSKLQNLDVLVLNALRKENHLSHLSLDEALHLIAEIKPKKTYLTHIGHQMGLYDEISKELPENVFLAYDGLELNIND